MDFLGIGLSATDYVGHAFGPDSIEIEDDMLALDITIGALLAKLDSSVGPGKYVVALTADHGVAPIPEQTRRQGRDAGRVDARAVVDRIEKALAGKLGAGHAVAQFIPPDLYFAPDVAKRVGADPALWRGVREAAMAGPGIADAILPAQGTASNTAAQSRNLRFDRMPERSGDAWIGLERNWIFSAGNGTGTTHGTAYDYDQRVPVILFGAGIKPGRYPASTTPADIAPTLAALSGVRIARTDGRVLREALAPAAAAAAR